MEHRRLGRTGFDVSAIGFGAWAIGGDWGSVREDTALATLHAAVDAGINFFDTADVYGDGRSERLLARLKQDRSEEIVIATKVGRRFDPHTADEFIPENLRAHIERSLENLRAEALDLVQLHCPPRDVYYLPEVFDALDGLVRDGLVRHYGVSVEKVEEALKAIEYEGVETVQIIFNVFRQRPAGLFFREAKARDVGVIARVPLASGLLTGKMRADTEFEASDHRHFNRHGEAFDVGETFAGVDFESGLKAVDEIRKLVPQGATMAQLALRWILMHDAVSTTIPGAKSPSQVGENARAAALPPLPREAMDRLREVYDRYVRPQVHHRW